LPYWEPKLLVCWGRSVPIAGTIKGTIDIRSLKQPNVPTVTIPHDSPPISRCCGGGVGSRGEKKMDAAKLFSIAILINLAERGIDP